jgi:hypothetical protein
MSVISEVAAYRGGTGLRLFMSAVCEATSIGLTRRAIARYQLRDATFQRVACLFVYLFTTLYGWYDEDAETAVVSEPALAEIYGGQQTRAKRQQCTVSERVHETHVCGVDVVACASIFGRGIEV